MLAGGQGTRMGTELPKQFLLLDGEPILIRTLRPFLACGQIRKIYVVTPADWIRYTKERIQEAFPKEERLEVIEGGADRSESLMQAIRALEREGILKEDPILITHDAVRPFVTEAMLLDNIRVCEAEGACVTLIPATDTIVTSRDGRFVDTVPDRNTMYQMQTPQTFKARTFKRCYEALGPEERRIVTDASRVLLSGGVPVAMVEGRRNNIKITFPEDLPAGSF